jgi:ubiquinone/menaquinone biosynthesis C-methylase UbiE
MSESNDWQVPGSGAEIYETVFVPAMMGEWALKGMALANPQPGERVLDIACGTGVVTRLAAESVGPHGRVVGVDLSPEMLAVAREVPLNPSTAAPIEWREGDASALPFANGTFDVVFCAFGLMSMPDRVATLREMLRVLVPDGRLAVLVWGSISKCPGQTAVRESFERHFGADDAELFYRQHALGDPETVLSLVHDAAFRDASVQTAMGVVRFPSAEHLVRSYGALAGIEADEQTRTKVIHEVSIFLHSYVGAEGLAYPIEAILANARR